MHRLDGLVGGGLFRRQHATVAVAGLGCVTQGDPARTAGIGAELSPVITSFQRLEDLNTELAEAQTLAKDDDREIRELAEEDMGRINSAITVAELDLRTLLIPKDPNDAANVFLEIRAGTGGDEAAIFSGDLFRMYSKYAEGKGWLRG